MEYRFPLWASVIPGVLAAIALAIGLVLAASRPRRRVGLAIALCAILFGVLFGPLLWLDRVTVTPERIEQRTGFWFVPVQKGFAYADVARVEIRLETTRRGLEREVWIITDRRGGRRTIDPGDLWEYHSEEICAQLAGYGVSVIRR